MGKSREVQDFLAGFTAGFKLMDDSIYKQALSEYYRNGGKGGRPNRYGLSSSSSSKEPNFFQRLFGSSEEPKKFENAAEEGLFNLKGLREQAVREGNVGALKKIDADIVDWAKMHGMGAPSAATPSGAVRSAAPARSAPAPKPTGVPEPNAPPSQNSPAGDGGGSAGGAPLGGTIKQHDADTPAVGGIFTRTNYDAADSSEPTFEKAAVTEGPAPALEIDPFEEVFEVAEGGYIDMPETAFADEDADIAVTERMAEAAAPGVDAGLRLMQARYAPQAGLPDADPNTQAGVQAFARNEGAATDEEVDAIDRVVDPEGKLPKSALSAARIAAVTSFYKDDPEKAADLANRLLMYDKRNAQTLGSLALQAIQDGDAAGAARFVKDGFNNTIPGGGLIQKADLREDGNFDVSVRTPDGPQKIVATPDMIQQAAASMANGSGWTQEVINQAARSKAAIEKPKAARGVPVDAEVAEGYMNAKLALRRAIQSNDPEAVKQAQAAVNAAEDKAIAFASKQKNPAQVMRAMGINPTAPAPKPPTPPKEPKVNMSEKERSEARDQQRTATLNKYLDNADTLEQAGVRVEDSGPNTGQALPVDASRRVSEGMRVEEARRSIEPIRKSLEREGSSYAYSKAKEVGSAGSYEELAGEDGPLYNAATSLKKPDGTPVLDAPKRDALLRQAYRLARKNDAAPGQIVEFLYNAQNDPKAQLSYDRRTGRMQIGNNKMLVDDDTLTDIARARGEMKAKFTAEENKRMRTEADGANAISSELEKAKRDLQKAEADLANYRAPSKTRSALEGVTSTMTRAQLARAREDAERRVTELRNKPVKGFATAKERKNYTFEKIQEMLADYRKRQGEDAKEVLE